MTYEELAQKIASIGIPYAYYAFPESDDDPAPAPPFICYFCVNSANFFADGLVFQKIDTIALELYSQIKDWELEERVEKMLEAEELTWQKEEMFLDDEQVFEVVYTFDILRGENNG